jgi:two-component system phosphate regulon sensor histidine kinase PhoR
MRSLYWKITLPFFIITLAGMTVFGSYTINTTRNNQMERLQSQLINEARLVSDATQLFFLSGQSSGFDLLAKTTGQQIVARVTIIAPNGVVLGDTWEDPSTMENHSTRPEIIQALAVGLGISKRLSATTGENMMYAAVPVISGNQTLGVARVALALTDVEKNVNGLTRTIVFASLLTALMVILLTAFVTRQITRPLRQITKATEAMAKGNVAQGVAINTNDELGKLGHAFNKMTSQLAQSKMLTNAEKSRLEVVLTNLADGIIMTGSDGNVVLTNPAAARLFDFIPMQAHGSSLIQLVRDHEIESLYKRSLAIGQEESNQIETNDGRFLNVISAPLSADEPGGALLLFQDLSHMRSLQTMRQEFVANVSHDLRTPLAGIKAIVETLQDGAIDDKKIAMDFLAKVDAEIDGLTQLVNELMQLSRIESGRDKLEMKPTDINLLLHETVSRLYPQAERQHLIINEQLATDLPALKVDDQRLKQVIINILHNAIKFTAAGGQITVTSQQEGGTVVVHIADTGIGILEDDLPHIFERFYKADKSRSGAGNGLGLAIAKHIIQAHGGSIWAQSTPGQGSVFSFSLPLPV